jgi:hypothetical protein
LSVKGGPGQLSRYSDSLRSGRSGNRIPVRARFSASVQNGLGTNQASCAMGTGSVPAVKLPGRDADHLPPSSAEVKERIEINLYSPFWTFMACSRVNFRFTFTFCECQRVCGFFTAGCECHVNSRFVSSNTRRRTKHLLVVTVHCRSLTARTACIGSDVTRGLLYSGHRYKLLSAHKVPSTR